MNGLPGCSNVNLFYVLYAGVEPETERPILHSQAEPGNETGGYFYREHLNFA